MKIELDSKLVYKIKKLGYIDETVPELIEKIVDHISTCQQWWEKRYD